MESKTLYKEDALQEIIGIATRNNITLADITAAMSDLPTQAVQKSSSTLSRLFGYIGGIFVLAGIGIFTSMFWSDMGSAGRVIITLGSGFVLFLLALVALSDKKYARAATPLFLMSSLLQPGGLFVMLNEYSSGGNPRHGVLFVMLIMLIQHGAVFISKRFTILAFTSLVFSTVFFWTLFDLWDMNSNLIGTVMGASLLCVAYALDRSRHAAISPFWYFTGSAIFLSFVYDAIAFTPFGLAYLGITAFLIFVSTHVRSRTLLVVSALGMISYITYFSALYFANTLGWPLMLIGGGLALVAFSSFIVKLNNKYIKPRG